MPGTFVIAPHFQTMLSDQLGADTKIDMMPHSRSIRVSARWTGDDPYVSLIEIDEFDETDQNELFDKLKSGLLRNRVRG